MGERMRETQAGADLCLPGIARGSASLYCGAVLASVRFPNGTAW